MGHPAAPFQLLLLLLLCRTASLTSPASPTSPCFPVPTGTPAKLNLTNSSHQCAELDLGPFQQQRQLLLSHNGIEVLSSSSRVGPGLEELDLSYNQLRELPAALLSQAQQLQHLHLQHNQLRKLPDAFFANATALKSLRLEGNPLPAVPSTAFQPNLRLLAVPCRCDVVGSVLSSCTCSLPNCTALRCHCSTSHNDSFNVTDFHTWECRRSVGLVAGLAGAAAGVAVLLVVTAMVCCWRRRATTDVAGMGWAKREPTMTHGQPRYISRADETGTTEMDTTGPNAAPDYENIFVSPCTAPAATQGWTPGWQEEHDRDQTALTRPIAWHGAAGATPMYPPSPQVLEDDNYFLESEAMAGDQPIYANTQGPGEDIYIIPDRG